MTATELTKYIGQRGMWDSPLGIKIPVEVTNAREIFGRFELRVKAVNGQGETWATAKNVQLVKK